MLVGGAREGRAFEIQERSLVGVALKYRQPFRELFTAVDAAINKADVISPLHYVAFAIHDGIIA